MELKSRFKALLREISTVFFGRLRVGAGRISMACARSLAAYLNLRETAFSDLLHARRMPHYRLNSRGV